MKSALLTTTVTSLERTVLLDMATAVDDGSLIYSWGHDRLALAIGKTPGTTAAKSALTRRILPCCDSHNHQLDAGGDWQHCPRGHYRLTWGVDAKGECKGCRRERRRRLRARPEYRAQENARDLARRAQRRAQTRQTNGATQ